MQRQLLAGERLFAFLDDIYVVTRPERVGEVYRILEEALRVFSCIRIHNGKTKIWNQSGVRPEACDRLERIAQVEKPQSNRLTHEQGLKVLGIPLGHDDFVAHHLRQVAREQQGLLDKIPLVRDLQSAWLLLLRCAAARANCQLRSVRPSATEEDARTHDEGVWQCLATLLGTDLGQCTVAVRELATLPLRLGGLGLTSASEDQRNGAVGQTVYP